MGVAGRHAHSVLVVADNNDLRDAYATMLGFHRITVRSVPNSRAAVAALRAGLQPCVVLVSVHPLDVGKVARRLRMEPQSAHLPMVLVADGRLHGGTSDITSVLHQPVDTEVLRAAVERHCGQSFVALARVQIRPHAS